MAVLLLRLAAPLQSWGSDSKFETRRTDAFPTKSGVVGLLAAALGRHRNEPVDDLANLKFGVRIDKEGTVIRDFHTALEAGAASPHVTNRYYLSDAVFLVGFESDDTAFLNELEVALKNPVFPLFLGRRSCPPTMPLCLGIKNDGSLYDVLKNYEWLVPEWMKKKNTEYELRIITDADPHDRNAALVRDKPVSFSPICRQYGLRKATELSPVIIGSSDEAEHDPMQELR